MQEASNAYLEFAQSVQVIESSQVRQSESKVTHAIFSNYFISNILFLTCADSIIIKSP